ncbi:hypothetical protein ONR57_22860 [Hoyosella sp. YIM 151337]|uniref:hypothetical protein n=1 Tax=Hoyosella sp. YIM 151337 TaxID=2992742 RepID=UPI002236C0D3|nr:hypothetical protein [Hoyosella sp. YIM 151337]MCW4356151.1 hypothetical protein [Hoyosella sp. YIM 151337]
MHGARGLTGRAAAGSGCAVAAVAGCSLVTWGYVYAWGSAHRAGEFTLTADHQEALGWGLWLANGQTLVAAAVLLTAVTYRTLQRAAAKPPAAA